MHISSFVQGGTGRRFAPRNNAIGRADALLAASRLDQQAALELLHSSPDGLDAAEAEARLEATGPNLIAEEGRPSLLGELWGRAKIL